ncbi:hypothetical protein LUZ60_012470 [Juncus effusus]|nr:hypothetical protein LUZ60_012470 [Juncus effusus]
MKIFNWLFQQNKILILDNLMKKGWSFANRCNLCCCELEIVNHLAGECSFVEYHWFLLKEELREHQELQSPMTFFIEHKRVTEGECRELLKHIVTIYLFCIWRERCRRSFIEEKRCNLRLVDEVKEAFELIRLVERSNKAQLLDMAPPGIRAASDEGEERERTSG